MLLNEMNWPALEAYLQKNPAILIPVGSMEAHGPHLPLNTDTIIASEIAKRVSEILGIVVAPPVTYTISALNRPGNVRLRPETFRAVFTDIISSFAQSGCRKFFVVLGHGGPEMKEALVQAVEELPRRSGKAPTQVSMFHVSRVVSEAAGDKHAKRQARGGLGDIADAGIGSGACMHAAAGRSFTARGLRCIW